MLKKIYNKSPVLLQNIYTTIYGYKLLRERYGRYYKAKIKELRFREDKEFDFFQHQIKELNTFLEYAKKNSAYYSNILNDIRLPIHNLNQLKDIPILDKDTIRANIEKIITEEPSQMIISQTGGTTGKSMTVYYTKKDMQDRMALLDYFKEQHGVKKGMKRASFSGNTIIPPRQKSNNFWRYNKALNQMLFSSFHATYDNIPHYIKKLNEFQPMSLDGFPSVMLKIAKYVLENNIEFDFQPIAIFPTAETLLDEDKKILERAFKCKVRNQYASSEGAPFITECVSGSLHLNIDTGVFEKANEKDKVSEIYVTSFSTHGTPLIRYKIGDSLKFTDERCDCGVDTPLVEKILGRNTDYLYSKESGTVRAGIASAIKSIPAIKNAQFVQKDIENITVNLVVDKLSYKKEYTKRLETDLKSRLGESMNFNFKFVEEIPIEKSGKSRFIINKIN